MKLDCLIIIGGDGTLRIAHELSQIGINIVELFLTNPELLRYISCLIIIGVPKTIDNDLVLTDTTFGFMSAVAVATDALDRLHTTAESHHRISILVPKTIDNDLVLTDTTSQQLLWLQML